MADTTNRLAGTAYLSVDGITYMVAGGLSYSVASKVRETLTGQDRVHGYGEKAAPGYIEATLRDSGSMSVAAFNAMTNVTVHLELANGKVMVGSNMWTVGELEVDTEQGTFKARWEGFDGCVKEG